MKTRSYWNIEQRVVSHSLGYNTIGDFVKVNNDTDLAVEFHRHKTGDVVDSVLQGTSDPFPKVSYTARLISRTPELFELAVAALSVLSEDHYLYPKFERVVKEIRDGG